MLPLSTMPPATVALKTPMPIFPVIVPELTIPPESMAISEISTPVLPAEITPTLVTPPAKVPNAQDQTQSVVRCRDQAAVDDGAAVIEAAEHRDMDNPIPLVATILPLLLISPERSRRSQICRHRPRSCRRSLSPGDASRPEEGAIIKINAPAVILPALPLTILPKKVSTLLKKMSPCIVPAFVIPPAPLLSPKTPTSVTPMLLTFDAILPLLVIPPAKVPMLTTAIAISPAEIVPLLTIPPLALPLPKTATLKTSMPSPVVAILPLLLTPPENVATSPILCPTGCAAITPPPLHGSAPPPPCLFPSPPPFPLPSPPLYRCW